VFVCAFQDCNSLVTISLPACTSIGISAFRNCIGLTEVSFPKCQTIDGNAFAACRNITSISFPECQKLNNYGFYGCSSLTSVTLPACSELGTHAFGYCRNMTSVTLPTCSKFAANAFVGCQKLTHLEIGYSSVAALSNVNAFTSTPMSLSTLTGSFGSIYVPASLVDAYKSATNWTYFSNRFVGINVEPDNRELITFTIHGIGEYTAEEGMTWREWCDSEYNIDGFIIDADNYVFDGWLAWVRWYDPDSPIGVAGRMILADEIIEPIKYALRT
jgi:hypothetical protein